MKQLKALEDIYIRSTEVIAIRGVPDVTGCYRGFFFALEFKRPDAKPDPKRETLQAYTCDQIRRAGGLAWERVDADNWEQVWTEFLRATA